MWEIFKEPMWFWLIIAVVFLVIELFTLGLTTIWFTGGAIAALISVSLGADWIISTIIFFVVSVLLLMLVRPIAKKSFNGKRTKTNAESLVGKVGVVFEDIDNIKAEGRINISGQEWAARSPSDEIRITAGTRVRVLEIRGVKLIVEKSN